MNRKHLRLDDLYKYTDLVLNMSLKVEIGVLRLKAGPLEDAVGGGEGTDSGMVIDPAAVRAIEPVLVLSISPPRVSATLFPLRETAETPESKAGVEATLVSGASPAATRTRLMSYSSLPQCRVKMDTKR